jgi:hypothetical protein
MHLAYKNPNPPSYPVFAVALDSVNENGRTYYAVFPNSSTLLTIQDGRKFRMSNFLGGIL